MDHEQPPGGLLKRGASAKAVCVRTHSGMCDERYQSHPELSSSVLAPVCTPDREVLVAPGLPMDQVLGLLEVVLVDGWHVNVSPVLPACLYQCIKHRLALAWPAGLRDTSSIQVCMLRASRRHIVMKPVPLPWAEVGFQVCRRNQRQLTQVHERCILPPQSPCFFFLTNVKQAFQGC